MKQYRQNIIVCPDTHEMHFRQKPCEALAVCKALCCRRWDIHLARHEYAQGVYQAEASCALDKKACSRHDTACPHKAFRLKKNKDGSCVYLDAENRCTIYAMRPLVCRNFICDKGFTIEPVSSFSHEPADEAEICSFEGGLELKTKFLFNPYLRLKSMRKTGDNCELVFKDITSCKDKVVTLLGVSCFSNKRKAVFFLQQFNGKNTAAAVLKKMSKQIERQEYINAVLYLVDEKVLVGLF